MGKKRPILALRNYAMAPYEHGVINEGKSLANDY